MPLAARAQVLASLALTFASASILTGCGAAATGTAAHPEVEVVVPKVDAPKEEKPKEDKAIVKAAKNPLEGLSDEKLIDILNGKDATTGTLTSLFGGPSGGVVGGVIGSGGVGGFGGLGLGGGSGVGLSGLGIGGGGSGTIGLGSIGTIGRGSGTLSVINPVPGNAIHDNGKSVVMMGDLVTLGVSPEDATRALRNQSSKLHLCYEQKGLDLSKHIEGEMALRIVIGKDAKIAYVASDSQRPSPAVVKCVADALKDTYVATPAGATFGVIETTIAFKPKK